MELGRVGRYGRDIDSSFSQVYPNVQVDKAIVISACKDSCSNMSNASRTDVLEQLLHDSRWGFIPIAGGYIEDCFSMHADGASKEMQEYAFLIPFPNQRERMDELTNKDKLRKFSKLKKDALALAKYFEQEAILIIEDGKGYYRYMKDGAKDSEKFDLPKDNIPYFSLLAKGNNRKRAWVFEGYLKDSHTAYGKHAQYLRGEVKR